MWMAGEPRAPVYSGRYYNPTNRAVERKIADLEGAEDALVFSSGMAAICTTLINFLGQGDRIVTTRNLYGGTVGVLDQDFVRFGIDVHYVDVRDLEAVENALKEKETKVLYCETVTNPLLEISDLPALSALAKKYGAVSIVETTYDSKRIPDPFPATLLENFNASMLFNDLDNATLKAPLKASPAPVVSFTSSFKLKASTKRLSLPFEK